MYEENVNTSAGETPLPFSSALLLVRNDDVAAVDRRALRAAGIRRIKVVFSGVEAARELAENARFARASRPVGSPDMVLCHEQLADMTGDEFVRLIRLHPALIPFPVIVAVATNTPAVRTKAKESGYSGLLVRPYTPAALTKEILLAAECETVTSSALGASLSAPADAFTEALDALARYSLSQSNNVEQVYRGALMAMRQQRWDEAIASLQRAAKLAPDNGEVLLGLAAAWRGKGSLEKSQALLREAVAVFVDSGAWERARSVSERLLRETPESQPPLQNEARRLLAAGKTADAAQALLCSGFGGAAGAAGPEGRNAWIYEQVARGCMATPGPEDAAEQLRERLAESGEEKSGSALRDYVLYRLRGGESAFESHRRSALSRSQARNVDDLFWAELGEDKKDGVYETPSPPTGAPVIALLKEPSTSPALNGFPLLRDAVAVAKVTVGLFRAGRKK